MDGSLFDTDREEENAVVSPSTQLVKSSSEVEAENDLHERLERVQENIRVLKSELLYRSDSLNKLRVLEQQKKDELEKSATRRNNEGFDFFGGGALVPLEEKGGDYSKEKGLIIELLSQFLETEVFPVCEEKRSYVGVNFESIGAPCPVLGDEEDVYQVDVYAERQVCSLKIRPDCTFKELMSHVVRFWSIAPSFAKGLLFMDKDGASFLGHLVVKQVLSEYPLSKRRVLLRHRPEARFDVTRLLNPQDIANRIQRMNQMKQRLLFRRHIDMKNRDDLESAALVNHNFGGDGEPTNIELGELDTLDEDALSDASSKDSEVDGYIAENFDSGFFDSAGQDSEVDMEDIKGVPLVLKQKRYFVVLDCVLFTPILVLMVVSIFYLFTEDNAGWVTTDYINSLARKGSDGKGLFKSKAVADGDVYDWLGINLPFTIYGTSPPDLNWNTSLASYCDSTSCFLYQYNRVVSHVRLQQIRVATEECPTNTVYSSDCFPAYSSSLEGKENIPNAEFNFSNAIGDPFTWVDGGNQAQTNWNFAIPKSRFEETALLASYPSSGYFTVFKNSGDSFYNVSRELRENLWLGENTRMLEVSYNTININSGVGVRHSVIFEKGPEGAYTCISSTSRLPVQVFMQDGFWHVFKKNYWYPILLACALYIILAYIILSWCFRRDISSVTPNRRESMASLTERRQNVFRECKSCCCRRNKHICSRWTILDMLIVCLCLGALLINLGLGLSNGPTDAANGFGAALNSYYEYSAMGQLRLAEQYLLAVAVFLITLRLARVLTITRSGYILSNSLYAVRKQLFILTAFFYVPVFIAFIVFAYVVFSPYDTQFRSIYSTFYRILRCEFGFGIYTNKVQGWVTFFTLAYMVFMTYFVSIMFIVVITNGYNIAYVEASNRPQFSSRALLATILTLHKGPPRAKQK